MRRSDPPERVLIIAPHADDEVLGCGGLMARWAEQSSIHVIYAVVDGFHHYGLDGDATFAQRVSEIEAAARELRFTHEILYANQDLIERLDTVPQRELVDHFEAALNEHQPDLLLLPYDGDYDQDHDAVFRAGFAAARPIPTSMGKWLVPEVLTYEMTKLNWSAGTRPRPAAYCDITDHLDQKLTALARYETQARPSPHIRSPESVTALAEVRGKEIGVRYAEAFGIQRSRLP